MYAMPACDMQPWEQEIHSRHEIVRYAGIEELFYPSDTTAGAKISQEESVKPSLILREAIEALGLSKSFAAKILGVSRPTLYAWLEGGTECPHDDNAKRIEWLRSIANYLSDDVKRHFSFYKHRRLGKERRTLEDILIAGSASPEEINAWLLDSIRSTKDRPTFGARKHNDTKNGAGDSDFISEMPLDIG